MLTYSKQEGFPEKSDINDEKVNKEWTIGIPSASMPNTRKFKFDVNTYRNDFKKIMIDALDEAIKNNTLTSDCGASVKSEYNNNSSRQKMLESYAEYVLNTVIYRIACDAMSHNSTWVAQVISTYTQYCDNILQRDSGVNAFLNYIFLTHAFEGEVKEDIVKFLDAMTAQVGFYGQLALTCAGQDNLQTTATKDKLRDYFVKTVTSINNRKDKAITGFDNYCYIVGTRIEADTTSFEANTDASISEYEIRYKDCDADSWSIQVLALADSVYLPIIYHQYTKLPQGTNSFGEYLNKFKVQRSTDNKIYMTNCRGVQTFALNEGIYMKATLYGNRNKYSSWSYFTKDKWYHIDNGKDIDFVDQACWVVHDKVVVDWFDSSNGCQDINAVIAARAFYGESHLYWSVDEMCSFASKKLIHG